MTQPPSADQFLAGGTKSASFKSKPIGFSYTGSIVDDPKVTQQTDPDSGELEFWPSGDPKWQLVVKIQTDIREDVNDDGVRGLYVKGKSLTDGVKKAVQDVGATSLKKGGILTVTYTGDGPQPAKAHHNPPKLYSVTYIPPADRSQEKFFGDGSPVPAAPPGMATAHQVNAAAAVAASVPFIPAGVDPAVWGAMTPAARADLVARIAAAQGTPAPGVGSFQDTPPY